MNYTEKYHLPQWEETDRIMRTDFNAAMAGIETGIEGAKTEARQADAELTKKVTAAQKTADTAVNTVTIFTSLQPHISKW